MQRCTTGAVLSGCVSLVALCLLSTMQIRAQQQETLWTVVSAGGVIDATDGVNRFSATLGQPIIGVVTDGGMQLYQGFWVPFPFSTTSVDDEGGAVAGNAFRLMNYPNPFSSTTTISYRLDERSHVSLEIFDLLGRKITGIAEGIEEPGERSHEWNGMVRTGAPAAGGYYLYVLTVEPLSGGEPRTERRKLLLVR